MDQDAHCLSFDIHGRSVEVRSPLPGVARLLRTMFPVDQPTASNAPAIHGEIMPFDPTRVHRQLAPDAVRLPCANPLQELYALDERFWLIDDAFGLCELNLLKRQFRAWVLPHAQPENVVDGALYWPLAQLLARPGFGMVPAISITREGWGALVLNAYPLDKELRHLTRAGYRVVGRRWTAISVDCQGATQRVTLGTLPEPIGHGLPDNTRLSAGDSLYACRGEKTAANAVLIIRPGRRLRPAARAIAKNIASKVLAANWPRHVAQRRRQLDDLPSQLAALPLFEVDLTANPSDLVPMLSRLRYPRMSVSFSPAKKMHRVA